MVEKLSVSINNGFDTVYDALNKKLNFTDNIDSTIAEFTVKVDASGKPGKATQFKLQGNQTNVQGLVVINCYDEESNPPPSAVFVSFIRNENSINIKNIKGLQANLTYTIKVLAIS